jgi:hypothetical protein
MIVLLGFWWIREAENDEDQYIAEKEFHSRSDLGDRRFFDGVYNCWLFTCEVSRK